MTARYGDTRSTTSDGMPMVGREHELAALEEALARKQGVVLVEGEAGVGKTRLIEALPATRGDQALMLHCPPLLEPFPLGPLIDALRRACPDGVAGLNLSPLAGALRPLFPEWASCLPISPEPLDSASALKHRLFRALDELLSALNMDTIVVEDAHWADAITLAFLLFRWSRPDAVGVLVLTSRPEDAAGHPLLQRFRSGSVGAVGVCRITLRPLTPEQVREQIGLLLETSEISEDFVTNVHRYTAGIPFAVEETLNLLKDRAVIVRREGGWVRRALEKLSVPPTVRDSILERVARLDRDGRHVLGAAAVVGRAAPDTLLRAVAGLESANFDSGLGQALTSGLLVETGSGLLRLRHALADKAIYNAMLTSQRRVAHQRTLIELEQRQPLPLAELVRHSKCAGDTQKWVRYAEQSADLAAGAGDERTMLMLLHDMLRSGALEPSEQARLAIKLGEAVCTGAYVQIGELAVDIITCLNTVAEQPGLRRGERGRIRLYAGALSIHHGDPRDACALIERSLADLDGAPQLKARTLLLLSHPWVNSRPASEHLRSVDQVAALRSSLKTETDRRVVSMKCAHARLVLGDMRGWSDVAQLPDSGKASAANKRYLVRSYIDLSYVALMWGRSDKAETWLKLAARLMRETEYWTIQDFLGVNRACCHYYAGRWPALAEVLRQIDTSEDLPPLARLEMRILQGLVMLSAGKIQAGSEMLHQALAEYQGPTFEDISLVASAALARLKLFEDQPKAALELTRDGMRRIRASELWIWAVDILPVHAEALIGVGDYAAAKSLVDAMRSGLRDCDAPAPAAALLGCRALLALHAGGPVPTTQHRMRAARWFGEAAAAWAALPRPYNELLALERQAMCLLDSDRRPDALTQLKRVEERLSVLGACWDADRVARVLREHDVAVKRVWKRGRKSYGNRLSPRELSVVRRVAAGQTNKQIAGALYLTPRTVTGHVSSAMRKLGVDSRTALALAAERQGLIAGTPSE